jgi:hypothetical protein
VGLGMAARRAIGVLALVGALCLGLVGVAGAEPVRFFDRDGDSLSVEPVTGAFAFTSPRLPHPVTGTARVLAVGHRLAIAEATAEFIVMASGDLDHQTATASVFRSRDHRLIFAMHDVTVRLPATPTRTPTPRRPHDPSPSPTRTATRLPTYTPSPTPTRRATNTPRPTATPTRPVPTMADA